MLNLVFHFHMPNEMSFFASLLEWKSMQKCLMCHVHLRFGISIGDALTYYKWKIMCRTSFYQCLKILKALESNTFYWQVSSSSSKIYPNYDVVNYMSFTFLFLSILRYVALYIFTISINALFGLPLSFRGPSTCRVSKKIYKPTWCSSQTILPSKLFENYTVE